MQNKKAEIIYFDNYIKEMGEYKEYTEKGYQRLVKAIRKSINSDTKVILDCGCGSGEISRRLSTENNSVIAFDISKDSIVTAKKFSKGKDIEFLVGDLEHLPFKDTIFDLIFCVGVLHHFPDLLKAVNEIKRILKKSRRFLAIEPNSFNPLIPLGRFIANRFLRSSTYCCTPNEKIYRPKDFQEVFLSCGLNLIKYFPLNAPLARFQFLEAGIRQNRKEKTISYGLYVIEKILPLRCMCNRLALHFLKS
ncbi:class I SAM-dependent methyltransferase [Candidatus Borrarchaeum sp.]|uniref:class I SAM-dependent methyltransferase n=1 Tax=Candidatus Borrarchaeum sp. TaxID=2846742 RepID=UPI00257FC1FD|nr:class I SAM-dependent methyltransferase [Candidatus Borrarchaeum sp.]